MVNVGGVEIDIRGDNSHFRREMRETQRVARSSGARVAATFDRTNRSVSVLNNSLIRSRTSMLALGAAAGIALTSATRLIANFEQSMSTVRAVTGATEQQFEALTARARELGATTRFTATQAADGMTFLARAGFEVDEVLGSIEGTLKLAQAGNLDLARAADIASNVLQGMKLEVSETARVVDVLALAANSSNTDVSQLGDALKFVAPVASGLNVQLEETTAAIGALSDAGLQSSLAGTGLRRVMIGLEKQSNEGVQILAKYGLTLEDVSVSSNGLTPALQKLAAAGITTSEAMTLFGLRGGPAFEVLASSVPKIEDATAALGKAGGTADRVAEIMDDNLNGVILQTVSALQELVIALGETGPTSALEEALKGLTQLLRLAAENADILAVAVVALTARAVLPLALDALPKMGAAIAAANVKLLALTRNAKVATVATSNLGKALKFIGGPATLAIAAAAAAFVILARDAERGRQAIEGVNTAISRANDFLAETERFETFNNLADSADDSVSSFNRVAEAIRGVSNALNDVTVKQFANEAQKALDELRSAQEALAAIESDRIDFIRKQQNGLGLTEEQANARFEQTDSADALRDAEKLVSRVEQRYNRIADAVFGDIDIAQIFDESGFQGLEEAVRSRIVDINNQPIIEAERRRIEELQSALGQTTTERAADRFRAQIAEAEEVIRLLENGVSEATAREIARENVSSSTTSDSTEADRLQEILSLEFQLDLARTKGDEAEIARLEDKLDIIARTQDLVRAGLTLADAEVQAREEVNSLREAENQSLRKRFALERDLAIRDVVGGGTAPGSESSKEETDEAVDYTRERLRDGAIDALVSAAQDRSWQDALGRAFYDVLSENMRDAFNDVFNQLGGILNQVFSGSSGSAIGNIFGGIGDFFVSSVPSTGSLSLGVGGSSSFKTDDFLSVGRTGDVSSAKGFNISQSVVVQGGLDSATIPQVQEMMAEQARALPGMIDSRVKDGKNRGRY
ncbi:MAG: phage tail tape measure protein [Pseudomonadota bacterium]